MGISFIPASGGGGGGITNAVSVSGSVVSGDAMAVGSFSLADGESVNVTEATLVLSDGQAAQTNLNLVIVTLDGAGSGTQQATIISGDGATIFIDETGDPLATHTNGSGGEQNVGIYVDNGNFGAGSGADRDVMADAEFTIEEP